MPHIPEKIIRERAGRVAKDVAGKTEVTEMWEEMWKKKRLEKAEKKLEELAKLESVTEELDVPEMLGEINKKQLKGIGEVTTDLVEYRIVRSPRWRGEAAPAIEKLVEHNTLVWSEDIGKYKKLQVAVCDSGATVKTDEGVLLRGTSFEPSGNVIETYNRGLIDRNIFDQEGIQGLKESVIKDIARKFDDLQS